MRDRYLYYSLTMGIRITWPIEKKTWTTYCPPPKTTKKKSGDAKEKISAYEDRKRCCKGALWIIFLR